MSGTPKRRSQTPEDDNVENSKKRKIVADEGVAEQIPIVAPNTAPDSHINHKIAIDYWSSTEPTVNGVLGGYPQVSRVDIQGSSNFLAKLRRQSKHFPPGKKLRRVVDCGAGIGRVTTGFLSKVAETVDIVEPVKSFTDQVKVDNVGKIYNVGLEDWHPERERLGPYDLIWNQWCVGQLSDEELVKYLKRLPGALSEGGWMVVKENLSNHHLGEDVYDETDSSVTRTDTKFRQLFQEAGLSIMATELQKGMPKDLYPVRAYALQPKRPLFRDWIVKEDTENLFTSVLAEWLDRTSTDLAFIEWYDAQSATLAAPSLRGLSLERCSLCSHCRAHLQRHIYYHLDRAGRSIKSIKSGVQNAFDSFSSETI